MSEIIACLLGGFILDLTCADDIIDVKLVYIANTESVQKFDGTIKYLTIIKS